MKNLLYVGNHLQSSQRNASYSTVLGPLLAKSGYKIRYTSRIDNKALRLMDMLWTTLRTKNTTDLVLIDTYSTQNFYYAVMVSQLCRLLKLPYIPILHGGDLPHRLKNSPKLSNLLFENAFVNVSPSLYLKAHFNQYGFQNVVHIPNTIALANYPFDKKTFDAPRLLWVRSFSEIYNPELAIQVLNELKNRGYPATLCMVGPDTDGSLAKVKKLADTLNVEVIFTGKLLKSDWISISKEYNVFINTTNYDNTPVSVIEAMALGLPVVSTNVGGMPYLIKDGVEGLLVSPNDKIAMANAICTVLDAPSRTATMTINARHKVEQFDWEKVRGLWEEVLRMRKEYGK
ncbi:glycosyltransferase family 4 protein [Gelidibacter salicanalis]|uniref:Glycosyltransferase family 4 protein n=1 Tax=Gelidibacter salicanalis TaxID=291193 RepID=A0A5C7ADD5_9FLAO|nr:glycosyltransferase family 4 protein [Gelidibacter salicanalis]TXE05859.1 glycosyltransferase family 4 protein [Gelidibacter salicanalis]